ncbi:MAG: heme exporter protein CcmD [Yoonia sp.]|jgi:heme exporter protein D|tara:strand:- start:320 stop:472 length:153 start_codon:yes stop_codon:yes gene_type:complete
MMPDLGKYVTEVLLAYGVSIAILATLVAMSWRQSRRVRRDLEAAEARKNG